MTITLEQIKSLRDKTGVSTMACKKALEEAGGNEEKAIELLRKKGEAKSAERSDRSTAHGVVSIASEDGKAAMIAIGCETDFVAKNEEFLAKVNELAKKLLSGGEETDLSSDLSDLNIQMGEKIEVKDKKVVEGAVIGSYIHMNNKIGALTVLSGGDESLGQDISMHIAAMHPRTLSPDDVSDELLEKEKVIWAEQLAQEGKPKEIIGKIMIGKEKKFREESALLTQAFVKNSEQLIKDLIGDNIIEAFYRFEV